MAEEGFEELVSMGSEGVGEWVSLAPKTEYIGELIDAFLVPGSEPGEKPRPAYVIRTSAESATSPLATLIFSERAALRVLRKMRFGTSVRLRVGERADIGKGKQAWKIGVAVKQSSAPLSAATVEAKLLRDYEQAKKADPASPF